MNKVFLKLSQEEFVELEVLFEKIEQNNWILEKSEDEYLLCGYFNGRFRKDLDNLYENFPQLQKKIVNTEILEECDWQNEYKKYLKPLKIGPLHIVPIWEKEIYEIPEKQFGIFLDAEVAFGTGSHETTQLCLARIVEYSNLFSNVLFLKQAIDVGCGSGILSIAADKLGFHKVYGFDNDPDAIRISKENAEKNFSNSIKFKVSDIKTGILGHQADFVMANILAPILIDNASILVNTIKKYGCLSLSGILNTEIEDVKNAFIPLVKRYWDSFLSNTKTIGQWSEIAFIRT